MAERVGRGNQGRYRMPPASSHGLRSDTLSSRRIIVQPPAIFKGLRLSRSALVSTSRSTLTVRRTRSQTTRAMSLPGPNATNPTHVPASALRAQTGNGRGAAKSTRMEQTKFIAYDLSGIEG